MQKLLLLISILCLSTNVFAQYPFENISLEAAIKKAKLQHKLIFLQFESPECTQCNRVARVGLADEKLVKKMEEDCIGIIIPANDSSWNGIRKMFNAQTMSGTLILDENGTLIHRLTITTTLGSRYVAEIEKAKSNINNAALFRMLDSAYNQGDRNPEFLQRLLAAKKKLNLDTDALLDEYCLLTLEMLDIKSIIYYAPTLKSIAYREIRKNNELFEQVWWTIPEQDRIQINNSIIFKSRRKAIENKDIVAAVQVASFARRTNDNPLDGQNAFDMNMIEFFKTLKDTVALLPLAVRYYERMYNNMNLDSIKKVDSATVKGLMKNVKSDTIRKSDGSYLLRTSVMVSPSLYTYTSRLNNAAFTIYSFTRDSSYLKKALTWVTTANDYGQSEASLDTQARILYALNQRKEAILLQKKAVELGKKTPVKNPELEQILQKMKRGEVL